MTEHEEWLNLRRHNDFLEQRVAELLAKVEGLEKQVHDQSGLVYAHTPHCSTCGSPVSIFCSSPKPGVTLTEHICPNGCDQGKPTEYTSEWILTENQ